MGEDKNSRTRKRICMDDDEFLKKSEQAIRESMKVVAQAEQALQRTEAFFREKGISPEQMKEYLKRHGNPEIQREIDMMVEQTMRQVQEEAEQAVRDSQRATVAPPPKRRFRNMI